MAENQIVYNITVNGVTQAITGTKKLSDEVNNAGNKFVDLNNKAGQALGNIPTNLNTSGQAVKSLNHEITDFGKSTEQAGAHSKELGHTIAGSVGEAGHGFRGLSLILRAFGIEHAETLLKLHEGLKGTALLLHSQEKLTKTAYNTAPLKEQITAVGQLSAAQKAANVQTEEAVVVNKQLTAEQIALTDAEFAFSNALKAAAITQTELATAQELSNIAVQSNAAAQTDLAVATEVNVAAQSALGKAIISTSISETEFAAVTATATKAQADLTAAQIAATAASEAETVAQTELAIAENADAVAAQRAAAAQGELATATRAAEAATKGLSGALKLLLGPLGIILVGVLAIGGAFLIWKKNNEAMLASAEASLKKIDSIVKELSQKLEDISLQAEARKISNDDTINALEKELELIKLQTGSLTDQFNIQNKILKLKQDGLAQDVETAKREAEIIAQNELKAILALNNIQTKKKQIEDQFKNSTINSVAIGLSASQLPGVSNIASSVSEGFSENLIEITKKEKDALEKLNKLHDEKLTKINEQNKAQGLLNNSIEFEGKLLRVNNSIEEEKLKILYRQANVDLTKNIIDSQDKIGQLKNDYDQLLRDLEDRNISANIKVLIDNGKLDVSNITAGFDELRKQTSLKLGEIESDIDKIVQKFLDNIKARISTFQSEASTAFGKLTSDAFKEIFPNGSDIRVSLDSLSNLQEKIKSLNDGSIEQFLSTIHQIGSGLGRTPKQINDVSDSVQRFANSFSQNGDKAELTVDKITESFTRLKSGTDEVKGIDFEISNLNDELENFGIAGGIYNEDVLKIINFNKQLANSFTDTQKKLEKSVNEFFDKKIKTPGIDKASINELESQRRTILASIASIIDAGKGINELQIKLNINELGTAEFRDLAIQEGVLTNFTKRLEDTKRATLLFKDSIVERFKETEDGVSEALDTMKKSLLENPLTFGIVFDNEQLSKSLKAGIDQSVHEGIKSINILQDELQKELDELLVANPEAGNARKKEIFELQRQLEQLKKILKDAGFQLKVDVDDSTKAAFKQLLSDITEVTDRIIIISNSLSEIASHQSENLIKNIEAETKLRDEQFTEDIDRLHSLADAQEKVAQESTNRVNDLEQQLHDARGHRAAFILKLLNEEQANEKKATQRKIELLKQEQAAKDAQLAYDKKRAADIETIKRREFEREKGLKSAEVVISTALAIAKDTETVNPITQAALIALDIGIGIAQLAAINSAHYEDGGMFSSTGQLSGPSHTNGGMPVINPVTGQKVAELEGNEYITSKKSTANNYEVIDTINKKGATTKFTLVNENTIVENSSFKNTDWKKMMNVTSNKFEYGGLWPKLQYMNIGGQFIPPNNTISNTLSSQRFIDLNALQAAITNSKGSGAVTTQGDFSLIGEAIEQGLSKATLQVSVVDMFARKALLDKSNSLGKI